METRLLTVTIPLLLLLVSVLDTVTISATKSTTMFSSKLIHKFSDEVKAKAKAKAEAEIEAEASSVRVSKGRSRRRSVSEVLWWWPEKRTMEYYKILVNSDFERQNMKLGTHYQLLFPSEGSKTMSFGNSFGWLHYTWIDAGSPGVSFLVALDAGSDLLWLPCECEQCAPLSSNYYNSLDRDLNEYNPSGSNTSKHIPCSHELCDLGSICKNSKDSCPYTISYYTENTTSSGLLVEDILHLASGSDEASNNSVQAPIIIGCGKKQTGGYLDGVAPDGLMGLGLGEISVPSFLAREGLIQNSFSMCFDEDDSGRLFFGDQGPPTQRSTPFLSSNGKYDTYIVGVDACCIANSCLDHTSFSAQVDSGTSFTFLPKEVFEKVGQEFDKRVNASSSNYEGQPFTYCYKFSSTAKPKVPSFKLVFPLNNSFVVHAPVFLFYGMEGLVVGFCLAIQPADGDLGVIGQNFMTGYRMVFDRENLKLGWSPSNCQDIGADGNSMSLNPHGRSPNPLPTNEQASSPGKHAVAPAVAGRAPSKPSAASQQLVSSQFCLLRLIPPLLLLLVSLLQIHSSAL